MNFSGEDGIIITLDNRDAPGYFQKWFNTSWISAFKEEDERLTAGGYRAVQIASVRKVKTGENFGNFLTALYWFDLLFCGVEFELEERRPFTEKVVSLICNLVEYAESDGASSDSIPQYILDIFDHWRFEKKRVTIYPYVFGKDMYGVPLKLSRVFFPSLTGVGNEWCDHDDDVINGKENLLTERILALFPEMEYLRVRIDGVCTPSYPFSVSLFITETLMGLHSTKNGNFQCDVEGELEDWLELEFEKLSEDFAPFELEFNDGYLRIKHAP